MLKYREYENFPKVQIWKQTLGKNIRDMLIKKGVFGEHYGGIFGMTYNTLST